MSRRSRIFSISAIVCGLVVAYVPATAQRLPGGVTPEHYTLSLAPDIAKATFTGSEAIDVDLAQPTASITLNAAEITFGDVHVLPRTSKSTDLERPEHEQFSAANSATVLLDPEKEQATLKLRQALPAGHATIFITYTGKLNNELRGFYLSKGPKRNYAVTQFESTDARRAFPGFDEPAMKATFDVTLTVADGDTAISNTNVIKDTPAGPGRHAVRFATTPRMSTYLLAFLVGDFKCISGSSDGTPIRACATPDKVRYAGEALRAAEFFLHYYDTYFGIKYAMPKLDMIGIPDFEAGAMENWGAITYRESDMLVDPKTGSLDAQKRVDIVVAHEMAHQWFGDLVTMQWWNNIWLNEGFANWMENKAEAHYRPDWDVAEDVAADLDNTLNLDAADRTRTIRAEANTPAEINQMFDGITYDKGGAVIGMVEKYVGEETFRRGVHDYLNAHKFANATAEDFWAAQTRDSGKPVDQIMSSFVTQPGVPLLHFSAPANGMATVTQSRFFLNSGSHPDANQSWTVPVCVKDGAISNCTVLTPHASSVKAPASAAFFANANAHGYYRSEYSPETFKSLVPHAEAELTPEERIVLLGDQWALMHAGKASLTNYLDLVASFRDDPSPGVLASFGGSTASPYGKLALLDEKVADSPQRTQLAAWVRAEFGPVYAGLPPATSKDSYSLTERRAILFQLLGIIGQDRAVIAEARVLAKRWLADPASINPTLSTPALRIAAMHGDAELFGQLQHLAETSTDPAVQSLSLRLLPLFTEPALETSLLEYAISGKVRNQDVVYILAMPFASYRTRDLAWQFVQTHWPQIRAQLTPLSGGSLVQAAGNFCSLEKKAEVDSFYATHTFSASARPLQIADDAITSCIALHAAQQQSLQNWLSSVSSHTVAQDNMRPSAGTDR